MKTNGVKAHKNSLKIGGYLKLAEWWKAQHAGMVAARRTYVDAASLATRDLKQEITANNCHRMAKELSMLLESAHSKNGQGLGTAKERLQLLEQRVAWLYEKLGEKFPEVPANGHA